jgi:hypothetical protein
MTNEASDRRDAQDELIIAALASGRDYEAAATVASTSSRTVRRRMSDPEFAAEVSRRRGERVGEVSGLLLDASVLAVGVLLDCLNSESDVVRSRAARTLIDLGQRVRVTSDHEDRLARLEGEVNVDGVD